MNKLKDYKLKFSGFSIIIIYVLSLKQKIFITKKKKKNHYNNIKVIAMVYAKCCNTIWGNRFVLQKIFVAINFKKILLKILM